MVYHANMLKKIGLRLLLLLFLLTNLSCIQQPAQTSYYDNGLRYAIQGRFNEAKNEFEKVLLFDRFLLPAKEGLKIIEDVFNHKIEKEPAVHIFKSLYYRKKKLGTEAFAEIDKALLNNSDYATAYYYRAVVYLDQGLIEQALADCNKAIEINPQLTSAYIFRGYIYGNSKLYDNAISCFNQVIMLDPEEPLTYVYRGNTYECKGLYDEAINDYNKAIEINPKEADAYSNRGSTYCNKGLYDKALSDINKAIDIKPNNIVAYRARGYVYGRELQYDQAISDFNRVIEANPRDGEVYNYLGLIYTAKGQYDEAIYNFDKAIKINPNNKEVYKNLQFVFSKGVARKGSYAIKKELEKLLNYKILLVIFFVALMNYTVPLLLTLFIPFKVPRPVAFVAMLEFLQGAALFILLYRAQKLVPDASNVNFMQIIALLFAIFHIYLGVSLLSLLGWARNAVLWFQLMGGYTMAASSLVLGILAENLAAPFILVVLVTTNALIYYLCLKKEFFQS